MGKVKKIIDIIEPNHIVIGDIYNSSRYIQPSILKSVKEIINNDQCGACIWYYESMSDIHDMVIKQPESNCQYNQISAFSWVEFCQFLIEDLFIKWDLDGGNIRQELMVFLLAKNGTKKTHLTKLNRSIIVMDWTCDKIDLRQKIEFLVPNISNIVNYIFAAEAQHELLIELTMIHQISAENIQLDHSVATDAVSHEQLYSKKAASLQSFIANNTQRDIIIWKSPDINLDTVLNQLI